jgi:regulator of replication initiation timing
MEISEGLKWIVGTIVAILSLLGSVLGISKLLELRAQRRYTLQDKNNEIHQSNQAKQIEFDQFAFQKFAERLDKVEAELVMVREKLSSQMEKNARLEVENQHLKETNERQQQEIAELRNDRTILQGQVNSLTNLMISLQKEIEGLKKNETASA